MCDVLALLAPDMAVASILFHVQALHSVSASNPHFTMMATGTKVAADKGGRVALEDLRCVVR